MIDKKTLILSQEPYSKKNMLSENDYRLNTSKLKNLFIGNT